MRYSLLAVCLAALVLAARTQEVGNFPTEGYAEAIEDLTEAQRNITKSQQVIKDLQQKLDEYEERLGYLEEGLLSSLAINKEKDDSCLQQLTSLRVKQEAEVNNVKETCTSKEEFEKLLNQNEVLGEENRKLRDEMIKLEKQVEAAEGQKEGVSIQLENCRYDNEKMDFDNSELVLNLSSCMHDIDNLTTVHDDQISRLNTELHSKISDITNLENKLVSLNEKYENSEKELIKIKNEFANIKNESNLQIAALIEELTTCKNLRQYSENNLEKCKSKLEKVANDLEIKTNEQINSSVECNERIENLKFERNTCQNSSEALERGMKECEENKKDLESKVDQHVKSYENCNKQLDNLHDESERFNNLYEVCKIKLNQFQSKKDLPQVADDCRNIEDKLENDKGKLAGRIKNLNSLLQQCDSSKNDVTKSFEALRKKYDSCISENVEYENKNKNCDFEPQNSGDTNNCNAENNKLKNEIRGLKNHFGICNTELQGAKIEIIKIQILITSCNKKNTEFLERLGVSQREINSKNSLIFEVKKIFLRLYRTAMLFKEEGKYNEALRILMMILEGEKMLYGQDQEEVIEVMNAIAHVLYMMDRFQEALPINQNALDICVRVLGENHKLTLQVLNNLAVLKLAMEEYVEALRLFSVLLERQRAVYGGEHSDVKKTLQKIYYINSISSPRRFYTYVQVKG